MEEFTISRAKDDKETFVSMERTYFQCDAIAEKTLNIDALMGALSSVKFMINLSSRSLKPDVLAQLRLEVQAASKKYRELIPGGPNDNWEYLNELHEMINKIYEKLKEEVK